VDRTVRIGSSLRLRYGELEEAWRIVGVGDDVDQARGIISAETPLARALLGHQAGDTVHVRGPENRYAVTILDVD
jgi:transcription elongation GreA/GreB family factor